MPRPPYDPQLESLAKAASEWIFTRPEEIRKIANADTAASVLSRHPHLTHTEHYITTADGATATPSPITLSVFQQSTTSSSPSKPRPAVYIIHGGGQVAGNRFSGLATLLTYFGGIDIVAIAVEYRLAPEHPAPVALNDAYDGLIWTVEHAADLGIDPLRVLIMGGSGGGPIAAGCAMLAARNKHAAAHAHAHVHPQPLALMLLTPMLDDRSSTISAQQFEHSGPWCGTTNRMAWECVLGSNRGTADVNELIAPARATDLTGLPPTFIDAGEAEVFRDEAVAFASVLWKCGVSAELHVWKGGFHGFEMDFPGVPVGKKADVALASIAAKKSWIRRIFRVDE
ncbi:Alpha/Beta hydrolase protein, partial [Aspergillus keveii]